MWGVSSQMFSLAWVEIVKANTATHPFYFAHLAWRVKQIPHIRCTAEMQIQFTHCQLFGLLKDKNEIEFLCGRAFHFY